MPFSVIVVSVIKQRARLKSLMLANLRMCVMNVGLRNTNGLCNRSAMSSYATGVRDKSNCLSKSKLSKHTSDLQSDFFRSYSLNNSEFGTKHSPDSEGETERLSDNQGPVRMSITEEGKLHIHVVDDDINNNNELGKINDNELEKMNDDELELGKINSDSNDNDLGKMNDDELGKINNNDDEMGKIDDKLELGKIKVDSKFMELILANRIEDAMELFQSAVAAGKSPQANAVVLLLQTLGKNGSVDELLQLQHILLDKNFCNEMYFIKSLTIAYHESARIQDAVDFLKTLCENNQDYSEVRYLFIYLTTMILKKFPQWQTDIVSIVNEYKISRFPELEKELWKCFILSENFKEAEKYVKETAELKEDIPALVYELNSIIRNVNEFSDEEQIWKYLLVSGEDLGLSRGFLLVIYEEYLVSLLKKHKMRHVILNLNKAKTNGIKIHKNRFDFLSRGMVESVLTEKESKMFKELTEWYQEP